MILKIRGWKDLFENSESRKLKRLTWVGVPNKLTGNGYTALVDHPNGAAHLGAWYAIVEVCSLREPPSLRGTLPESDGTLPGIARSLGRISRLPPEVFAEVLPRLIHDPNIQWIEQDTVSSGESPGTSGESPDTSGIQGRGLQGITGKGTTATSAEAAEIPPLNTQSEYPLVLSEIRRHDPAADEMFVLRLVQKITQHLLSHKTFPQDRIEAATTDKVISKACAESFSTGRPGHGVGLLLNRVPNIIVTWGTEKEEVSNGTRR